MRLHRLEFEGIGPYASRQTVDFDALSTSGLFLIEGPTGAGKSTIIDAIVWGLYGTVAGGTDESTNDRMRSILADPKRPSYVDLVFSVESGTYRVRRQPAYRRPGNKNETPESAKLWRLGARESEETGAAGLGNAGAGARSGEGLVGDLGTGQLIATKSREVGNEIQRIVGFNRAQFAQTVVLPQGKFAEFLGLSSKDRAALLGQIFDTARFGRVAADFEERAKDAGREVERARADFLQALGILNSHLADEGADGEEASGARDGDGIDEAAGDGGTGGGGASGAGKVGAADESTAGKIAPSLADADAAVLPADGEALVERARTEVKTAEGASRTARERAEEAETAHEKQRAVLQAAQSLAERLARRSELLARQAELAEQEPAVTAAPAQLQAHREAQPLLPHLDAVEAAAAELDEAEGALTQAATALAAAGGTPVAAAEVDAEHARAAEAELERLNKEEGRLVDLEAVEESLAEDEEKLATAEQSRDELAKKHEELGEEQRAVPGKIAAAEDALKRTREAAARLEGAEHARQAAAQRLEQLAALDAAESTLAQESERAASAHADYAATAGALDEKMARWSAAAAARLALRLEDGEACPVCGSETHPSPATPHADDVTDEDIEAAKRREEDARRALSDAEAARAAAAERARGLRDALAGVEPEPAEKELERAEREEAEARQARDALATLEQDLASARALQSSLGERETRLAEAIATQRAEAASLAQAIVERRERISGELHGYETIRARRAALTQRVAAQREWVAAVQALVRARDAEGKARAALTAALADSRFATAEEVRSAALAPDVAAALEREVREHERATTEITHDLAAPELASLTGEEQPGVEAAETLLEELDRARRGASERAANTATRAQKARTALREVTSRLAAWSSTSVALGPIARLASIAKAGDMSLSKVSLTTYVLIERFNAVVAVANEQLQEISRGRYELVRTDEKEHGSRQTQVGLGLAIIDNWEGERTQRSTKSLSGGEKFYVSLSLALGLVDVVRAENGGIALDTLLIDEGFGSLDAATLDTVMDTLHHIAHGGRTVGVISHVEDMKHRIAERITVRQHDDGTSSLEVHA